VVHRARQSQRASQRTSENQIDTNIGQATPQEMERGRLGQSEAASRAREERT